MLRVAIERKDTGMVIGDGETDEQAWADAERLEADQGVTLVRSECLSRGYDTDYWHLDYSGGIAVLRHV